ncbi:MAG: type II toxin-antitoxin system RelE/ParE family toxin [Proteobacteria bacterium]|nr:type II toxin-antitoxin system RelE/ParE family toxin [Pseudomonadota bacterium]
MKGRFVLTPRAQADLDEIWDYTTARWGTEQADTYTRQIWRHIQAVADRPSLGRECEEVRAGYRQYPSGSHVLFYRLTDSGIDIVRILHERMDHERHIP